MVKSRSNNAKLRTYALECASSPALSPGVLSCVQTYAWLAICLLVRQPQLWVLLAVLAALDPIHAWLQGISMLGGGPGAQERAWTKLPLGQFVGGASGLAYYQTLGPCFGIRSARMQKALGLGATIIAALLGGLIATSSAWIGATASGSLGSALGQIAGQGVLAVRVGALSWLALGFIPISVLGIPVLLWLAPLALGSFAPIELLGPWFAWPRPPALTPSWLSVGAAAAVALALAVCAKLPPHRQSQPRD